MSIEGPKNCGKTWCARYLSNSEFSLVDPADDFINLRTLTIIRKRKKIPAMGR